MNGGIQLYSVAVRVTNADRLMTRANVDPNGVQVSFADEVSAVIPFSDLPEIGGIDNIAAVDLPNPHELILSRKGGGEPLELPWDYVRRYCDPAFASKEQATGARGRKTLGARLRRLRKSAGITQRDLAAAPGVGRVTVARIERGLRSPRYATLESIAEGLGLPIEALLVDGQA